MDRDVQILLICGTEWAKKYNFWQYFTAKWNSKEKNWIAHFGTIKVHKEFWKQLCSVEKKSSDELGRKAQKRFKQIYAVMANVK